MHPTWVQWVAVMSTASRIAPVNSRCAEDIATGMPSEPRRTMRILPAMPASTASRSAMGSPSKVLQNARSGPNGDRTGAVRLIPSSCSSPCTADSASMTMFKTVSTGPFGSGLSSVDGVSVGEFGVDHLREGDVADQFLEGVVAAL